MSNEPWFYLEDSIFPKTDKEIFIWDACGIPHVCRALYRDGKFRMVSINGHYDNVIAWMEIPSTPLRIARREVLGDDYEVCFKE